MLDEALHDGSAHLLRLFGTQLNLKILSLHDPSFRHVLKLTMDPA